MNVEIVFTGLCSFLNVRDINPTMPEPSVILVQTNDPEGGGGNGGHGNEHHEHAPPPAPSPQGEGEIDALAPEIDPPAPEIDPPGDVGPAAPEDHSDHNHISFIAFDKREVVVDNDSGFLPVTNEANFLYHALSGVEIWIENDPPAKPEVDPSYDWVIRKDDYFPEVANQWNRDYVPQRGRKPKKSAVTAFMRFGSGRITSAKLCPVKWRFEKKDGSVIEGHFPEEVIYSDFPHSGNSVVVVLTDLETGELVRRFRFTILPGQPILTLSIGNNVESDMDTVLRRVIPADVREGDHFKFLNRTAANLQDKGPIPKTIKVEHPPAPGPNDANGKPGGGVGTGGACGPNNGNS